MSEPLHYITLTAPDGEIIGYAWTDGTRIGLVDRAASSSAAYKAGIAWSNRMQDAHRRGLTPAGVLALFSHEPGASPVTEAPDMAALEELARVVTPADDQRLLDQLAPAGHSSWRELAEAYDALTDEDRDVTWGGGEKSPSGAIQMPYPVYSEPLRRVVRALTEVGAVTPEHRWMDNAMPEAPADGRLMDVADAVRAATAVVRGERFSEGTIAHAVKDGLLDAVVASLRAWAAAQGSTAAPAAAAPAHTTAPAPAHTTAPSMPSAPTAATAGPAPSAPAPVGAAPAAVCRHCGGFPAVDVAFRAHLGLLFFLRFRRMDGPVCRTCGLALHRGFTTYTLCWGWWSPLSLVLFGWLTVVRNLLAVRRVERLPEPGPAVTGGRFDPGVPVHRRPLAYVALIPLCWVLSLIVAAVSGGG
jgi:hypothetical protein